MERRSQSLTSSGTAPGDLMLPATTEPWPEFPQAEPSVAGSNGTEPPEAEALVADSQGAESPEADSKGTESPEAATLGSKTLEADSKGTDSLAAAIPGGETPVADSKGTDSLAAAIPGGETPRDETPGTEPANGPDDTVVFALPIRPQGPGPQVPATPRPAKPPSWARVLATTLRLWAQRRFRRRSQPERASRGPIVVVVLVLVVAVVVGAGAVTVALTLTEAPAGHGRAGTGALDTATTVRDQAASWVASQVAADAIVACDPAMCSVLQGKGIPASLLLVLASGKADPLGSDVVMATAAVRGQFGSRLAGVYAPVVLASFGQGSAQIVVRAVAPDGAPAYLAQLRSDWHARVVAGRQLLHNSRLHASAAARGQLAAGDVDSRLLTTLATMAALYPIDVAGFSGSGAHASAGIPLRSAEISGATGVAGTRSAASLSSLKAFLLAQRAPYLPAEMDIVRLATGQAVLRVIFTAPSPLGLLGSNS
jgi:hypothetical protein